MSYSSFLTFCFTYSEACYYCMKVSFCRIILKHLMYLAPYSVSMFYFNGPILFHYIIQTLSNISL